jgi:dimethylglycine dehydrogenase
MLTSTGRVYAEHTITGMDDGKYLIVTGGGSEFHDLRRLHQIAREDKLDVELENITEKFGTLTVASPMSGALMERISDQDFNNWGALLGVVPRYGGHGCRVPGHSGQWG